MEIMKEKYSKLYDAYIEIVNDPKSEKIKQKTGNEYIIDSFTAIEGVKYRQNDDFRFMLVGWAPNAWDEKRLYDKEKPRESFVYSSIMNLTNDSQVVNDKRKGRFEWIADGDEYGRCPHNCFREGIDPSREIIEENPYHLSAKIWNYPKEVWCTLAKQAGCEDTSIKEAWKNRWYDNIVWSDLYKLYPVVGGNPLEWWKKCQFTACADLLTEEIRYFKPTHILFATDIEWFEPFNEHCFQNSIVKSSENKYVKLCGKHEDVRIVVTCRPDNRKAGYTKAGYINETVAAFNALI